MTEITLALGGGGAKGNAHVGVLRALEQEGFEVKAIAGTSIGGLIAAVYACGYPLDEIEQNLCSLDQSKLFGHQQGEQPSLLGLAGITEILAGLIGERTFDELTIPLAVTAVDVNAGRALVLHKGRVLDAVLATIAIPGIFPAREYGDYLLVDGGLHDPVPVDVARILAPNLPVVAVVLTQPPDAMVTLPGPGFLAPIPASGYITKLKIGQALNTFVRSLEASTRLLTELRLRVDRPDVIIRPDVDEFPILGKIDVGIIIKRGEEAVNTALEELRYLSSWQMKLSKRLGLDRVIIREIQEELN